MVLCLRAELKHPRAELGSHAHKFRKQQTSSSPCPCILRDRALLEKHDNICQQFFPGLLAQFRGSSRGGLQRFRGNLASGLRRHTSCCSNSSLETNLISWSINSERISRTREMFRRVYQRSGGNPNLSSGCCERVPSRYGWMIAGRH